MQIDVKKHRARRGLVVALELFAVLVWVGGLMEGMQLPGTLGLPVVGEAVVGGLVLAAFAAILETMGQTRYLTALMAQRMLDGATPEEPRS